MMPSSSPLDKPLYSYVVATSRLAHRHSQSETSSSPTSAESDCETVAQKLGIADMSHLGTERFQVDRRKLEKMIKSGSSDEGFNCAEIFFDKIMRTTDTFITWPRNLKIGARSRRDPYVRIVGRPDDNTWAKGLILASLATRGPLLKMKITISNTDHPHIIGRGGNNVNRIMEETETHVHFPDSNRRNSIEKSNEVSIYGSLDGLERARSLLRSSTPLLISFELPLGVAMPRHDTPFVKRLETTFNVKVIFYSTPSRNPYMVLVKGSEFDAEKVKEAVKILINSTCGVMAPQTLVSIQLEISQQLYDIGMREDNTRLLAIMACTQTTITFPDLNEVEQYSQVTIQGQIDGVYEAKQELMGCLPVELIFDLADNHNYIEEITSLGPKYRLCITTQQKHRDNTWVVVIKGSEKFIQHIYAAHQEIIDMQTTSTSEPEIPKAYFLLEPAYRRALENNINSEHSQYEIVSTGIWAPTEPNSECNFLQVTPSTEPISISLLNNFAAVGQANSPYFDEQHAELRATLSPDSTDCSEAAYYGGRRSSDWMVMKAAEGATSEDESQHFECDFDSEDLEVAFIFMSSPTNNSPIFSAAPGAEINNGW